MIRVDIDLLYLSNDYIWLYENTPFTGIGYELENGVLSIEANYRDGILDGATKIYEDDKITEEEIWLNGVMISKKEFYFSGSIKLEKIYEFGICVITKYFNEKGEMTCKEEINEENTSFELLQTLKKSIQS